MIFSENFFAISNSSGNRAIVPSSFITSTNTPADSNPARRARSTAASVCPVLRNTPPAFARSGKICPGLPNAAGCVCGSTNACMVLALSCAEIPVVVPCPIRSTETVKAVSCKEVLEVTIGSSSSCLQRSSVSATQISPRPSLLIKLMTSGVVCCAAIIKSPSFSRSSSSTTITILPLRISSIAFSILSNIISCIVPQNYSRCFIITE